MGLAAVSFRDCCARPTAEASAFSALDADARAGGFSGKTHHGVDDAHCVADGRGLEAHRGIAGDELLDGDAAAGMAVEVDAVHLPGALRHRLGGLQDGLRGAGRGCNAIRGRHDALAKHGRSAAGAARADGRGAQWAEAARSTEGGSGAVASVGVPLVAACGLQICCALTLTPPPQRQAALARCKRWISWSPCGTIATQAAIPRCRGAGSSSRRTRVATARSRGRPAPHARAVDRGRGAGAEGHRQTPWRPGWGAI